MVVTWSFLVYTESFQVNVQIFQIVLPASTKTGACLYRVGDIEETHCSKTGAL